MRVIGGKYRGKKLNPPKDGRVRPTTDMVKENIFNIIQSFVQNSVVLDLFAGSGALGIEALSRGAEEVVFVDNDRDSKAIIDINLSSINEKAKILLCDYKDALDKLKGKKFDIIFIDAPYIMDIINIVLNRVKTNELLNNDGIIVYECSSDNKYIIGNDLFQTVKLKIYGTVAVYFLAQVK